MSKRDEIAPNVDNRYIRRDDEGRIKRSVETGASLSADARQKAEHDTKPGPGDRGDRRAN
jgi:hypothetical protein